MKAIPITEDRLIELGLYKKTENKYTDQINYSSNLSRFFIEVSDIGIYVCLISSKEIVAEVKYVHELQNLYHCLGEDLTIR